MTEHSVGRWAADPRQFLVNNLRNLKKGSVLDIGGSDGTQAIYLAQHGFDVTSLDKDSEAVNDLQIIATDKALKIRAILADISASEIDKSYDNIISFYMLHYLLKNEAQTLLDQIREKTVSGGMNLIIAFTNVGEFEMKPNQYYPEPQDLLDEYVNTGWEIIDKKVKMGGTKSGKQQERIFLAARKK